MPTEIKKRPKKGAAKVRHLGRSKAKENYRKRYYDGLIHLERKILHLLKNNSIPEAQSYAGKHLGGTGIFLRLVERFR